MIAPALSNLDVRAFYEAHGAVVSGKPTNSREGKEWACSCPECGGTDRASFWESGRFCCVRGCGIHASSPYWFLRDIKRYSHQRACEELGLDPRELFEASPEPKLPLFLVRDEPPNRQWQDAAHAFCQAAEKCLWSSKGSTARVYLQSRGIKEETISAAHLGLCPEWYKAPLKEWGLDASQLGKEEDPQIKIPRGIVIPWLINGAIWKIQLRRPDKQYFEVLGSSEPLYNIDSLHPSEPVILVESELDALSGQQEAGELAAWIATGGVSKARIPRNIAQLRRASIVLQSFDDDPAGEQGAKDWSKLLPENVRRWAPWSHDINDMLTTGQSILHWLQVGLDLESADLPTETPIASISPPAQPVLHIRWDEKDNYTLEQRIAAFQSRPCMHCNGYDYEIDPVDGQLICPCVQRKREANFRLKLFDDLAKNRAKQLVDLSW